MNITDEMVERAKAALVSAQDNINEGRMESSLPHPEIVLWPSEYEYLVEAILTAALGDVEPEPLESVLDGWFVTWLERSRRDGNLWYAAVEQERPGIPNMPTHRGANGTGPTIDAAIRAAVANAKETDQ